MGGGRGQRGRQRQRRRRSIAPFLVLGLGVAVLLGALYLIGIWGSDNEEPAQRAGESPTAVATATATATSAPKKSSSKKRKAPTRVSLRLTATDHVFVCVEDASGKPVVNGGFLEKGQSTKTFRSKRFRANFGNGSVRMSVDGKRYPVANNGKPVGYEMRPGKKPRRLSESVRAGLCAL
jgi:hypothetical protein